MVSKAPQGSLLILLEQVPDPRRREGRTYPLASVLGMLILGALNGERSLRGMLMWNVGHWELLSHQLGFRGNPDAPVYGTVWNIMSRVDVEKLDQVLREWLMEWYEDEEEAVSVDGKTLRGSRRVVGEQKALKVITAAGHTLKIALGQREVKEGGEIEAAIELLRAIPLEGKLVTADAGIFHRPFVKEVLKCGGDYLGVVKNNIPEVKAVLEKWIEPDFSPSGKGTSS